MPTPIPLRLVPRRWLLGLREACRPYVNRFMKAYLVDSPWIEAKCVPVEGVQQAYIVPRASRDLTGSPDGIPVPPKELWVDYTDDKDEYLAIGRRNVEAMRAILAAAGRDIAPGHRILDLGCAGGPMLRCLKEFKDVCELWGCDISQHHVSWCEQNFPEQYKWLSTTTLAHLPFEDRYFDLIYAGSVFSHMGASADAWLMELARVIRPGGTLYITVVTRESMERYLREWPTLEFSRDARKRLSPDQLRSDFVAAVIGRSPWQHVVYDVEYFKRKCERMFDVVSVTPNVYSFQWAFLLSRKSTERRQPQHAPAHVNGMVEIATSRSQTPASKSEI